ncbi:MAG: tRNA pseudouridine(55) synthase TruB [Rhodocyclaceae bacterium]|nr:tRNA pseudouridine(55) synthase TruB [Rhodocyclaceae bacterium]
MNAPRRPPRRKVDGVLLLDKPLGISSNAALQQARRLFNAAKAGHTGTLDPLATGLLPLCFGEATKFASELLHADKAYCATVQLGVVTDTADAEGRVLETRPVTVDAAQVRAVLPRFMGLQQQVPPMYSALKRDGTPLYELARQGIEVARTPRAITIHSLELSAWSGDRFNLAVACSKGTYVRTLAADIGQALGCGAHLAALRRTRVGMLDVRNAISLESIDNLPAARRDELLMPPDALLADLPAVLLPEQDVAHLLLGQPIRWAAAPAARCRLTGPRGFFGLGEISADGWLRPKRLMATAADVCR